MIQQQIHLSIQSSSRSRGAPDQGVPCAMFLLVSALAIVALGGGCRHRASVLAPAPGVPPLDSRLRSWFDIDHCEGGRHIANPVLVGSRVHVIARVPPKASGAEKVLVVEYMGGGDYGYALDRLDACGPSAVWAGVAAVHVPEALPDGVYLLSGILLPGAFVGDRQWLFRDARFTYLARAHYTVNPHEVFRLAEEAVAGRQGGVSESMR